MQKNMNKELERKAQMIAILRGKTQNEEFGNLAVLPAGRYNCVIEKVYEGVNTNDKLFFGIKSTILSGDNKQNFVIECIYLNDDALDFLYDQMIADRVTFFQDMDDDEKIENLDEYGIDHGEEDLDEYAEDYAEAYIEKEGYTAKNAYDYWLSMFGSEQEVINMLKHNFGDFKNFLDITDVWNDVEAVDGIGNIIGRYDGREYDFKDLIIFRVE